MRFMMTIAPDKNAPPGPPDPRLMAAIARLGEEMTRAGKLVESGAIEFGDGITRVRAAKGQLTRVDGPFPETKELIAGYAVFEVESKEEAVELGMRFMRLHQEILGPAWEGETEVRRMFAPGPGHHPPG